MEHNSAVETIGSMSEDTVTVGLLSGRIGRGYHTVIIGGGECRYNPGDAYYIIESNRIIREVKVLKITGGFATLRFMDSDGGTKLRESRLFPTKKDAETSLPKKTTPRSH